MKYRALRGVCVGVDRHLKVDDVADLDSATGQFLLSIKAVEKYVEPVVPAIPEPVEAEPETKSVPAKAGKKEK